MPSISIDDFVIVSVTYSRNRNVILVKMCRFDIKLRVKNKGGNIAVAAFVMMFNISIEIPYFYQKIISLPSSFNGSLKDSFSVFWGIVSSNALYVMIIFFPVK